MKEIKFRAYNIVLSRFQYFNLQEIENQKGKVQWHILIIEQYTGFRDRNGKEIYEGDILSDYVDTDEGLIKSFRQVFWDQKRGMWRLDGSFDQDKSTSDQLCYELTLFRYEVSGNIHEHSDLLTIKN